MSDFLSPRRPEPDAPANTVGLPWDAYSGVQMTIFGRQCYEAGLKARIESEALTHSPAAVQGESGGAVGDGDTFALNLMRDVWDIALFGSGPHVQRRAAIQCRLIDALKALATPPPQPEQAGVPEDTRRLDFLEQTEIETRFDGGDDYNDPARTIFKRGGNTNDREYKEVSRGQTLREAVDKLLAATPPAQAEESK